MNQKGKNVPSPGRLPAVSLIQRCSWQILRLPWHQFQECRIIRHHNANCYQGETEHLVWNKGNVHCLEATWPSSSKREYTRPCHLKEGVPRAK